MKKNLITIIFMTFTLLSYAQKAPVQFNTTGLKPFIDIAKFEASMTHIQAFTVSVGKVKTLKIKDLPAIIDAYTLNFYKKNGNENYKNAELLVKYRENLGKYIDGVYLFSGAMEDLVYELKPSVDKINFLPLGFAEYNKGLIFYQTGIYYNKVLNNVKLNADERAGLIAKEGVVPSLNNFKPLLDITDIKYFGIIYSFIAKDFTSDATINADGETVTIVIPKEVLKKLINLEITPEEAYATSTFYNSNKNTDGALRKINIK